MDGIETRFDRVKRVFGLIILVVSSFSSCGSGRHRPLYPAGECPATMGLND
jgi:hypothetical protein